MYILFHNHNILMNINLFTHDIMDYKIIQIALLMINNNLLKGYAKVSFTRMGKAHIP